MIANIALDDALILPHRANPSRIEFSGTTLVDRETSNALGPKSTSMPPQDRVRLNDAGQTEQARLPSGHPNHQGTVTCPKPDSLWGSPSGRC